MQLTTSKDFIQRVYNSCGVLLQGWLKLGNKQRATAATGMNDKSSRSHSVFTLVMTQTQVWPLNMMSQVSLPQKNHKWNIFNGVKSVDTALTY